MASRPDHFKRFLHFKVFLNFAISDLANDVMKIKITVSVRRQNKIPHTPMGLLSLLKGSKVKVEFVILEC